MLLELLFKNISDAPSHLHKSTLDESCSIQIDDTYFVCKNGRSRDIGTTIDETETLNRTIIGHCDVALYVQLHCYSNNCATTFIVIIKILYRASSLVEHIKYHVVKPFIFFMSVHTHSCCVMPYICRLNMCLFMLQHAISLVMPQTNQPAGRAITSATAQLLFAQIFPRTYDVIIPPRATVQAVTVMIQQLFYFVHPTSFIHASQFYSINKQPYC